MSCLHCLYVLHSVSSRYYTVGAQGILSLKKKKKNIYIYIYIYIGCALILRLGLPFLSHLKKMDSGTLWTENESGDIAASLIMTIAADFARPETV